MLNIVIFGAPGSGKGTQSDNLIKTYNLFHISTGDVLRDNIKRGTELGAIAKAYIDKGQLIPDNLMIDILASVLDDHREEAANGVIFDGFPRTIAQAEALETMLQERGTSVTTVVGLEVPEQELIDRILLRGKLSRTGLASTTTRLHPLRSSTSNGDCTRASRAQEPSRKSSTESKPSSTPCSKPEGFAK